MRGMNPIMTLEGQTDLPRYFAATFSLAKRLRNGRIDFRLPDGRLFSVDAPNPGPVGEIVVHNPDVFARLIRESTARGLSDDSRPSSLRIRRTSASWSSVS